ncbi:MAG: phosphatase PAP2 family protein [Lautropia sp.]
MITASSFAAFGNAAVMLPIAVVAAGLLAWQGHRRCALAYLVAAGVGMALVALSKFLFFGWGVGIRSIDLTCASGHTFLATAIWPVLFFTAWPSRRSRAGGFALGLGLAAVVGITRVSTDDHSVSEVVAGWLLGGAVLAVFVRHASARAGSTLLRYRQRLGVAALVAGMLAAPTLQAQRLPSEHWLQRAAIALSGNPQPMTRSIWHAAHRPAP